MKVLVKTVEELLATPNAVLQFNGKIRCTGESISVPVAKQEDLCGKVVFCYADTGRERWRVPSDKNSDWILESWMIKEVLIE